MALFFPRVPIVFTLSYNNKLHMQTLREQGLCEKAIISITGTKGEN